MSDPTGDGPLPRKPGDEADPLASREDALPRMSVLEHLDELRSRLFHAAAALVLGFGACWFLSETLVEWLLAPVADQLPEGKEPVFLTLTEPFFTHLRVAFLAGTFLVSPYLIVQVWLYISPGLYRHEKRIAVPFVLFMTVAFLAGGAFGYWIGLPRVAEFLLTYGTGMEAQLSVRALVSMVGRILLGLGIVFELPVLIFFLARIGLVTPRFLMRYFPHALVAIFVVAAAITPTGDIPTLLLFGLPMVGLYLLGVGIAWLFGKPRRRDDDE
jgi:sec-independent protein translocase protein TatC